MKKIKITQQQYNRLILAEQKRLKSNNIITENEEVLEEGWLQNLALAGFLSFAGFGNILSAQEQAKVNQNKDNVEFSQEVVDFAKDKTRMDDLYDYMVQKKVKNPENVIKAISNNAETFANNFEDSAPEDYRESKDIIIKNIASLPNYVSGGYSIKNIKHDVDTIKAKNQFKNIIVQDSVGFEMGDLKDLFISGTFQLSKDGLEAISQNINTIEADRQAWLNQEGVKNATYKIVGVEITSSTDKQYMAWPGEKGEDRKADPTGNIRLSKARSNAVKSAISGYDILKGAVLSVNDTSGINKGETTLADFRAAGKGTEAEKQLQDKEKENRGIELNFIIEKSAEFEMPKTEPDRYVDKFELTLRKNYEITHKTVKIKRNNLKIVKKDKSSCKILDTGVANCFKKFGNKR